MSVESIIKKAISDKPEKKNKIHKSCNCYCFRTGKNLSFVEENCGANQTNSLKKLVADKLQEYRPIFQQMGFYLEEYDIENDSLILVFSEDDENDLFEGSVAGVYNYYMNGTGNDQSMIGPYANRLFEEEEEGEEEPQQDKNRERQIKNTPPKKVSQRVKSYFDDNYLENFNLSTDAGNWKAVRASYENESINISWKSDDANVYIYSAVFPDLTNKIRYQLSSNKDVKRQVQTFKIPISTEEIQEFFQKIYLNHLRHFINKEAIKEEPFASNFVFWSPHKLDYDYSFSSPNRNEIIHNLLNFINIRENPILDKFFEENELRHKQGYLQTLLNAANKAGIVDFERKGNKILVFKGENHKAFLKGQIRRT